MLGVDPTDDVVRVFVSYSRKDQRYLADDSLLGFLKGLSAEAGVEFWTDERITAGSLWNDEIRTRLEQSDIALVLVSQPFLDSPFCTQTEIESFLDSCRKRGLLIFPIVLSPCEWEHYEWLATRQFLPGGTETIEEHYTEPGKQKRLFLRIRKELRKAVDRVRQARGGAAGTLLADVPGAASREIRDRSSDTLVSGPSPRWKWPAATIAVAVVALVAVATWIAARRLAGTPAGIAATRLDIALPPELSLIDAPETDPFAISPDGTKLAFVAMRAGLASLYVRRLDSVDVREVEGSNGASMPFWSSDGNWLGFSAHGKLWKTKVSGGARPEAICDAPAGAMASWVGDTILFADRPGGRTSIFRISSSGGRVTEVMHPDATEARCAWPRLLPDGHHFLYISFLRNSPERRLAMGTLDSTQRSVLVRDASHGRVVGNDWIVFVHEGKLLAQRIDAAKGVTIEDSSTIAENISWFAPTAAAHFDVSTNGTVVYESNTSSGRLVVADRRGTERILDQNARFYALAVSPDGKRVVVSVWTRETGFSDLWIYDVAHGLRQRFTTEPGATTDPFWSPDGRTIGYSRVEGGSLPRLALRELTASTSRYVLPESESGYQLEGAFSPDGKTIYYGHRDPRYHIYRVSLSDPAHPQRVLGTDSEQLDPKVSPDGKWLAFVTGDLEIHVLNLVSGEQIPVTNGDYRGPRWRGDGRELFSLSRQGVVSITPGANGEWNDATVTTLFAPKDKIEGFDVTPDGQSILLSEWTPGPTDRLIHVVTGQIGGASRQ